MGGEEKAESRMTRMACASGRTVPFSEMGRCGGGVVRSLDPGDSQDLLVCDAGWESRSPAPKPASWKHN